MAFIEFMGNKPEFLTITKVGILYIPVYLLNLLEAKGPRVKLFIDDQNKNIIALKFAEDGNLKLNTTQSGASVSLKKLLSTMKFRLDKTSKCGYKIEDGFLIIKLQETK